jgi:hypothetical protein
VLLVTAGCIGTLGTGQGPAADRNAGANTNAASPAVQATGASTVTVGAGGTVEAEPEQAVVRVSVRAQAGEAREVRRTMAERAERLRAGLGEMDVDVEVVSANYDIRADRQRRDGDGPTRFVGHHSFVLTVDAPDRAGDVVVTAVENGASTVDGVRFTVTDDTRRDLREQALDRAMRNARGKADVLAERGGLELTTVRSVSTGSVRVDPYRAGFALAGGDGAAGVPTSFEAGTVTVSAQVQVTYEAEG